MAATMRWSKLRELQSPSGYALLEQGDGPRVEGLDADALCDARPAVDALAQFAYRSAGEAEDQDLGGLQFLPLHECVQPTHQRVGLAGTRAGGDQYAGVQGWSTTACWSG